MQDWKFRTITDCLFIFAFGVLVQVEVAQFNGDVIGFSHAHVLIYVMHLLLICCAVGL